MPNKRPKNPDPDPSRNIPSPDENNLPRRSARYIPPPPKPIIFGKKPLLRYHHERMHLENYTNKFGDKMGRILPGTKYCDVTMRCRGAAFQGHKVILAAYSEWLNETFIEMPSEGSYLELQLDNTSPAGLEAMVDFIYTGAFKVTKDTVYDILQAANDYQVDGLISECEIYLLEYVQVSDANYINMFNIAKVFNLKKLIEKCKQFFSGVTVHYDTYLNFLEFAKYTKSDDVYRKVFQYVIREHRKMVKTERLLEMLNFEEMKMFLKTDRHEFYTDLALVEMLVNWVEFKLEQRLPFLPQLFRMINLRVFDEENLDFIADMLMIKDDKECVRLIEDTRKYLRSMDKTAQQNGPLLLTFSSQNIELRAVKRSLKTSERNILVMPRIPKDFKDVPGVVSQRIPFVAVLDNILFVFGLYWRGKPDSRLYHDAALSCHSYDPCRNQWRELSSLQGAQTGNKLVVCEGKIYSIAGMASMSKDKLNQVEVYYPEQDTWRATTPLPYSVATPLATAANDGHIYVSFANAWNAQYHQEFLRFNTSAGSWLRRALVPKLQEYHDIGSCGGLVYLFGTCSRGPLSSGFMRADCYEPEIDQWTIIQTRRFGSFLNLHSIQLQDRLYIVADYIDKTKTGPKAEKTGIFSFDPAVKDLLIEREYHMFERDRAASALLFVPDITLTQIQNSNY